MFTRKKSFYKRKEFYIGLVLIMGAGFMLNSLLFGSDEEQDNNVSTNAKQSIAQTKDNPAKKNSESENTAKNNDINNYDYENNDINSQNNVQESQGSEYYLVKESDGFIKVYYYDSSGNEKLLRTTDILFSLISEKDQELFSEGVVVKTEDELIELLQDFES